MMPKTEPDPYAILGVARNATEIEIRAVYHALVAKYHPDKHQGNPLEGLAAEKMAEINRAYEILSDPARRAAYDGGQGTWPRATASGFPAGFPGGFPGGPGAIPRKSMRWLQILALLMLLPILLRFGAFFVRLIVRLVRATLEVSTLARGTPLAAVLVLLVIAVLAYALIRRRRAKRKASANKS
jgi:curved DNA-binding protein CbpA